MEKKGPGVNSDELVIHHYPSPTTDGNDASFYGAISRTQPIDLPPMEQQPDSPADPATPQPSEDRPSVSAQELQLAAQLSQGLAPMMEAAAAAAAAAAKAKAQGAQRLQPHPPAQNRDAGNRNPSTSPQDADAHEHDAGRIHIMPQQPHQFGEATHTPQHVHSSAQMAQMAQQAYLADVSSVPPRKRSKVSRACDECRRKKVKCDAVIETPDVPCTNCRKSQMECLFSRVPQKRGPSKGYIKELADRINSIEGKLGGQGEGLELLTTPHRDSPDSYSPAGQLNDNAKRPYSSFSADSLSATATRHAAWASEPRAPYASYARSKLAPRSAEGPAPPKPVEEILVLALADPPPVEAQAEAPWIVDDGVFQEYLSAVHRNLPLLASTRPVVQEALDACPPLLRSAFVEALNATMLSLKSTQSSPGADARAATRRLAEWESEPGARTPVIDLVHLQTLILLAMEADSHGPASLKGQHGGLSKTSFLARAVAIAYGMGLRAAQADATYNSEIDPSIDDQLPLRAWWILVALDRWNAAATGEPLLIPQDTVVLAPGLRSLLGEAPFQFLKLSYLIGPWVTTLIANPRSITFQPGGAAALTQALNTSLELWRVDLPPGMTSATDPVVFLAYWHCRLLNYLLMPSGLSTDVMWAVRETFELLSCHPHLLSPLNHYFTCLAGLVLVELVSVIETHDEAMSTAVEDCLESSIAPSNWDAQIRAKVADKLRPGTSSGLKADASQSLQRLADLAATEIPRANPTAKAAELRHFRQAENYEDMGFDPRPMLRAGYLTALRSSA